MSALSLRVVLVLALATLSARPVAVSKDVQSVAPGPRGTPSAWDSGALERVLRQEMKEMQAPGAAMAIVRDGQVVLLRGYGVANVETGEPVTEETLFRIGSTTKMFTGLAAAQFAAEGKLAMDAPISRWTQGLHPAIGALTLHQLLTHTAGLINEPSADGSHDDAALARRVKSWTETQIFAPSGDVYSYSSPGYWLAGHVVEAVAGKPFADVIAERVLRPAGMMRSTFRPLAAMTYSHAQDHHIVDGKPSVVRPFPDDVSTWPGGSLFSSARELAEFAKMFLAGGRIGDRQVIPESAVRQLTTRQTDTADECGYTYGLADCTTQGVRTLSHYGFRSGSGSVVVFAPEQKVAIIILANRAGGIMRKTDVEARRMLLGVREQSGATQNEAGQPLDLASIIGSYVHGPERFSLTKTGEGVKYQYKDRNLQAVKAIDGDTIAVLDADGAPEQYFTVVKGRRSGTTYLSDGLMAFRKR